jgi:hypothetical protein
MRWIDHKIQIKLIQVHTVIFNSLKEIENDLIGFFSIKNGNPPKYQFKNLKI